ncbi:MAG: DUF4358 domain-containing protein [Clostridia bacterium]|nr:DUF4358 domain-containing protein [Clostridia bacterium]
MKKISALIPFLLLILVLSLVSCGSPSGATQPGASQTGPSSDSEPVVLDIAAVAARLASECSFSEELTENSAYLSAKFRSLAEQTESCVAYVPTGITPEEVFVFEMKSEEDTAQVKSVLESYVSRQKSDYADYAPLQVPKLENPVILTSGKVVVFVVSVDNEAAESVAKSVLGIG